MLWDYIKSRRVTVAVWAIICTVFAAVFALYSLPLKAVLYGAAVSGFFGLTAAAVDFIYYRRKRLRLKKLATLKITVAPPTIKASTKST